MLTPPVERSKPRCTGRFKILRPPLTPPVTPPVRPPVGAYNAACFIPKTVVIPWWYEGSLDGRSTGGLSNRPPVLKPLSTKAFQKRTGGGEVEIVLLAFPTPFGASWLLLFACLQNNCLKVWNFRLFSLSLPTNSNESYMLDRAQTIEKLRSTREYLSEHYGVSSMLLFGSVAKNEQKEDSDVDVCVEMKPNLFRQAGVKVYLQELLGCSVDVVRMRDSMNQLFKQQIQKYGVRVY